MQVYICIFDELIDGGVACDMYVNMQRRLCGLVQSIVSVKQKAEISSATLGTHVRWCLTSSFSLDECLAFDQTFWLAWSGWRPTLLEKKVDRKSVV